MNSPCKGGRPCVPTVVFGSDGSMATSRATSLHAGLFHELPLTNNQSLLTLWLCFIAALHEILVLSMKSPLRAIFLPLFGFLFPFITRISLAGSAEALQALEKVSVFPFGGVGVAGTRTTGDTLFVQLAKDHNNASLFHSLWKDGTNEAKCYALLGLYWLKDSDADRFAQTFASGHITVATAHGCMVGTKEEVATFVASFKSGEHIRDYFPELASLR